MRTKEICQELFYCNSSAMDISERKNHACMIFTLGYVHEISADL